MHFKEFLDILNQLSKGQKIYFKPVGKEVLNAYHPDLKHKIFNITIESDNSYKLKFITLMHELMVSKTSLEQMFNDREWGDYMPFDLFDDYDKWHQKT